MQVKSQSAFIVLGQIYIINVLDNDKVVVRHSDGWSGGFSITKQIREMYGLPVLESRDDGREGLWLVCGECNGEGKHSNHLGMIRIEDWEDEDLDRYFAGAYDKPCGCGGGFVWMDAEHSEELIDSGDGCECQSCTIEAEWFAQEERAIRRAECGYSYE
jgi:hypothetical protein